MIVEVAREIADGAFADQFPVDVFQTGSGTSTNMNMNEVIATLASRRLGRPVHPNDHVNASQSSNDTFPSAIRIAAATLAERRAPPGAGAPRRQPAAQGGAEFDHVVKSGRTHLMDAVPVTLGQEFGGLRPSDRARRRAHRRGHATRARAAARWHRGRHRAQRARGLRDRRHRDRRRARRVSPSSRPPTTSRPRVRRTRSSRRAASAA